MPNRVEMREFNRWMSELDDIDEVLRYFVELVAPFEGVTNPSAVENLDRLVAFCNYFRDALAETYWGESGGADMQCLAWISDVATVPPSIEYSPLMTLRKALGPFVMRMGALPRHKNDPFIRKKVAPEDGMVTLSMSSPRKSDVMIDVRIR